MNTQVMSGSDKLHEDYQARKRHREWWVDLNRDIGGGFPEEVTLEYGPSGSQGESYVYVLGEEGSKLREQDEGLRQGGAPGVCLGWGWGMRSSLEAGGRLRASSYTACGPQHRAKREHIVGTQQMRHSRELVHIPSKTGFASWVTLAGIKSHDSG